MSLFLTKLLLSVVLIASAVGVAAAADPQTVAVLTVPKMCCAKESVPAIKELNKVPGVARVAADHKARTLTIMAKPNESPSPRAIWEAVERANVAPARLATTEGIYQKKPTR